MYLLDKWKLLPLCGIGIEPAAGIIDSNSLPGMV
jgi:hypothetical protein